MRTGCSWVACGLFKLVIGIPVVLFMILIWLMLAIALCLISAFLAGLMIFLYGLEYIAKSNTHDCLKLLFLVASFIFLPLTWSISALPGFFIPIVNLCYKEKLILDPNTLENLTIRIFSCLRIFTLIWYLSFSIHLCYTSIIKFLVNLGVLSPILSVVQPEPYNEFRTF